MKCPTIAVRRRTTWTKLPSEKLMVMKIALENDVTFHDQELRWWACPKLSLIVHGTYVKSKCGEQGFSD
jgi:hypothetical protein